MNHELNKTQLSKIERITQWISNAGILKINEVNFDDFLVEKAIDNMDDIVFSVNDKHGNTMNFSARELLDDDTIILENSELRIKCENGQHVGVVAYEMKITPLYFVDPNPEMTDDQRNHFNSVTGIIDGARGGIATTSGNDIEIWYQHLSCTKNMNDVVFAIEVYTPVQHKLQMSYLFSVKEILESEVIDQSTLKLTARNGDILYMTGELMDTSSLIPPEPGMTT